MFSTKSLLSDSEQMGNAVQPLLTEAIWKDKCGNKHARRAPKTAPFHNLISPNDAFFLKRMRIHNTFSLLVLLHQLFGRIRFLFSIGLWLSQRIQKLPLQYAFGSSFQKEEETLLDSLHGWKEIKGILMTEEATISFLRMIFT